MLDTFGPCDWLENFRMSKQTFIYLCNQLRPEIERQDTHLRRAISTEQRVAVTLWCLATPSEYRTIAHLFGIARSTVCSIVHDTCHAIVSSLMKSYIKFPTGDELQKVVDGFNAKWGFPQCVGAIDGSHIPISAPELHHTDYYNRKGWYSMVVQAVVDHEYLFRDICVGWPGSVHDARIFANSLLFQRITQDGLLSNGSPLTASGCQIPVCIIGDSAYPLQTWLMKPFIDSPSLTNEQKHFNYRLSRARIVVENAFGRLKARWRHLMKRNDMRMDGVPCVISACCILHNLCEIHGESFHDSWMQHQSEEEQPQSSPRQATAARDAPQNVRNALMRHLYEQQSQ